jgi:predicted Rossmann-fold nucleotide-binding protein
VRPTIVLVTGGRKYGLGEGRKAISERNSIYEVMDKIRAHYGEIIVVCGGAPGLDSVVSELWCRDKAVHCAVVKAIWNKLGPQAGPIRNAHMLVLRPDVCVHFPGGPGTADMVAKATAAGVPTYPALAM